MFIALFKFLRGYVKVRISGYSPERFLNLCSNHDILLWNIENHCDYYIMCISTAGFFQLKPFLKKTKTKVVVLERYGLPFSIPKLIKRRAFIFGLLGCVAGMLLLSNYVWAITFTGNSAITTDILLDYLEKKDITYGTRKKDIAIEQLEESIREDYDNITWTSVRISGTKLEIMIKENENIQVDKEISEKEYNKEMQEQSSDLVANKEGTVIRMITRNGVPQVAKDSVVAKGDILIKGQIPIMGDDGLIKNYQYCKADADIYLQCIYDYKEEVSLPYQKKVFTGREIQIPFVEVFGNHFTFYLHKNRYLQYDKFTNKKQIKVFDNFYLPVFYGKTTIKEYHMEEVLRQVEEGSTILNEKFKRFVQTLEKKGVQIIEKNVKIEKIKEKMVLKGQLSAIELTGESVSRDINLIEQGVEQVDIAGEQTE